METCLFEGHEKYIDIQYITEGCEVMGVTDISNAVIDVEYSDEKDVAFYKDCETASYCNVEGGAFCVFYPHDIHRPGIAFKNTPSNIRKIVVKVRV